MSACFACGEPFDEELLGRYGCPNCNGESEMGGDYFISTQDDVRVGRVMHFVGEKGPRKWVAYSVATDEKGKFRTLREASNWLVKVYSEKGQAQ